MKIGWSTTLVSALLLTVCLVTFIPTGLRFASTWREPYIERGMIQNYLTLLGFSSLGFVVIGLIVLWAGYRKKERWAWLVMLAIIACFVFPGNVLPPLLISAQDGAGFHWSYWFGMRWWGDPLAMRFALGVLNFIVMLIALFLPIRAFWFSPSKSKPIDEYDKNGISPVTGLK